MFAWNKHLPDRNDNEICAPADGREIDLSSVSDPVFAQKMMGDGTAFLFAGNKVDVCAPANGVLVMVYPTGHAFGIKMNNGVELMVHIGIDTVNTNGQGFRILKKKGDTVKVGEPVVSVDYDALAKDYDMSTMCIITDANGYAYHFDHTGPVKKGEVVASV